jgi:zinc transport system substrate-binding protein
MGGDNRIVRLRDVLLLVSVLSIFCSRRTDELEKIGVVVTIEPLAELVERIGGDKVAVSVIVPRGASPHSYEPTPSQLIEVSKAKMYVKVGSPIEFELVWLDKLLAVNREMSVTDASSGISLRGMSSHEKDLDPHVWLSLGNAAVISENIYEALISIDPDNDGYYRLNRDRYADKLDSLNQVVGQLLENKKDRRFMVYHPAWSYFAEDYDLVQIPIEAEGKEPSAKDIQRIIEQARTYGIKVIFVSPQFNIKSAEVIAREIGARIVMVDPLAKDYIANLKKIAIALSETVER